MKKLKIFSLLLAAVPFIAVSCTYNTSSYKNEGKETKKTDTKSYNPANKTTNNESDTSTVSSNTTETINPQIQSVIQQNSRLDFWKLGSTDSVSNNSFVQRFNNSEGFISSKFKTIEDFWNKWKHLTFTNSPSNVKFLTEFEEDVNFKPENGEKIVAACFEIAARFNEENKQVEGVAYFIKSGDKYYKLRKSFKINPNAEKAL
ncbi:Uncharacterised protein [Mesomycoplasma conjunctivae]|uniref:Lipoprotein n=1 Tax=Mesomycoplasma conjunctivae (strain ATCC 25834 / NCTC 10147 / HRC/581) TaxID=572263 RepID=C5J7D8_MESCH|nr:hypothetical protein [Mesomycoplasma conjunctivae]CAT05401.1 HYPOTHETICAL PROTEIN MCJ_007170 [Mesomycoplasma conjunctivae]VEU66626.1 Uncharacterised protein [Mesomycoplasma conjunctivae]